MSATGKRCVVCGKATPYTDWTHCEKHNPWRKDTTMRKPTIYEALRAKLGRDPTNAEIKADVKRILEESLIEQAEKGRLPHQRKRR